MYLMILPHSYLLYLLHSHCDCFFSGHYQASLEECNSQSLYIRYKVKSSCSVVSSSLRPHGLWPTRLPCPWDFPGKSTGVGCHFLLQRIFPTQGSNPGLHHCRQTLYHLNHEGSPGVAASNPQSSKIVSTSSCITLLFKIPWWVLMSSQM